MSGASPQQSPRRIERVRATVMFADLVGFTALSEKLGPEEAYRVATGCLRLLDGVVRRHGGAVDKYLGDALMAVFGYPVRLEQGPAAAVRAALEMQREVASYNREIGLELPLGLYVGINTGPVTAGDIRGPVVREFHVLGDAVNTAARIKSKAPIGHVYVGPDTWEATRDLFVYEALKPMAMKGKAEPVPVFDVRAARRGAERLGAEGAGPLVGREAELVALRDRLGRLAAGEGGVVAVVGPEGIGKSRLLAEATSAKECEGVSRLFATAPPVGNEAPLYLLEPLLETAGLTPGDDRPALVARLAAWLREATARRPLALVFEDLQSAHPASLEILEALLPLARECPLLFVLSSQRAAGPAERLLEAVNEAAGDRSTTLELGPLSALEARRLVETLLGDADVTEPARDLIVERAGGIPARLALGAHLGDAFHSETERAAVEDERSSETERRRSTILFADITGFTAMSEKMEPTEAYPVVAGCLALLDGIARKHGGTVDKYMGDCVLALYGVPKAIEDAPRAALNAAIEMVQAVRRYSEERQLEHSLDVHVGVNTGLGIAGDISGPLIREFAVMGDSVVAASELCDRAERGEIFVGPETWRQTREDFEFEERDALEIKGRSEPLTSYELCSRTQRLHRARVGVERRVFSNLVGREEEMARLGQALEDVRAGRGGIISLVAEAGVGKSRLIAELAGSAAAQEVAWREGRSLSTGQQLSFHPFADLCRSWAGITDDDDDEAARDKLHQAVHDLLGERTDEAYPFLATLMGLHLDEAQRERLERIEGQSLEKLIRAAVTQLLRAGSQIAPVVVVLDDLHWADASSIELLESLLRLTEDHAILFLHPCRPGFASTSDRIREYAREHHAERHLEFELQPLDDRAARRMVKNLFREDDLPQATRALIEEKARGNPFYIEEVVRSLLDQGAVEYEDGRFVATERIHNVEIPGTVQEVVMARVDRLGLRRRQLLQLASVIGQSFHHDILEEVRGPGPELAEDLDELQALEFLVPWDRLQGEEYAFKHPLIQEVAYDGILRARREELHRDVAQATERRLPPDTPGFDAMLAYHFSMGRDAERAETYLFRAGDEAARVAASSEALHFFQQASKLYFELHGEGGDPDKKALLEKNVALALLNKGQFVDATDHFDRAAELLGERVWNHPAAVQARFLLNLLSVVGGLYLPHLKRRRPPASPREVELFDVVYKRAMAQQVSAPMRMFSDCLALLRRVSKVDPYTVPEAAAMYAGVVAIFSWGGISFDIGRRFLDIARELAEGGAVDERILYYRTLTLIHYTLEGDWSDAHDISEEEFEEGLRLGRLWDVTMGLNIDAAKRLYQGDFARTRERIEQVAKIADLYQHEMAASVQQAFTAYLHIERRELPEALEVLERYYDEHPEPMLNLLAFANRARAESLMGEFEKAEASLERARELLAGAGRAAPWHSSAYHSTRYLHDVSTLERAHEAGDAGLQRAVQGRLRKSRKAALAAGAKVAWRRTESLRLAGRETWLRGRHKQALAWWQRALECGEHLGARPELARTRLDVARALEAWSDGPGELAGHSAAEHREAARTTFQELDLAWDLDRLELG